MAEVSAPGRKIKQVHGCIMYVLLLLLSLPLLLTGGGRQRGFMSFFHGGYQLLLALISILRPQLCRERLFEAKGDPVPPKRRGEADDSAALRDRIQ